MISRRTWIWTFALILVAVYGVVVCTVESDTYFALLGINLLQIMAVLFAVCHLFERANHPLYRDKTSPWLFYAIGASCYFASKLYWTLHMIFYRAEPAGWDLSWVLWMGQFAAYIAALSFHLTDKRVRFPKLRFYLDILIFTICAAVLYGHYFLDSHLTKPLLLDAALLMDMLSAVFSAGMVFALIYLYLYNHITSKLRVLVLLIAAFFTMMLSALVDLHIHVGDIHSYLWQQLPDFGWFAGMLLLGLAGASLIQEESPEEDTRPKHKTMEVVRKFLPIFAIVILLLALINAVTLTNILLVGTTITIILLLIRLLLSMLGFLSTKQALTEAERKYRNLVENSQVGVFSAQYGILTYVNRYFADTFEYAPEEMLGTSFMHYFSGQDRQKLAEEISRLAMNHGFTSHIGVKGIKKDGSSVHLEVQVTRTVNQGDAIITGTLLNITERKLAEEVVIRSEKLSVVGQLAAGVAHEIRNPLTSLRGFTQLLKARTGQDQDKEYYDIMLTELDRINYIVGEFMLLSKPQQMQELDIQNLKELLGSMLPIIETQAIIHNVIIDVDWQAEILPVMCDKNQIKQVFMNILKNAIEAMPNGGTIQINFYQDRHDYSVVRITDEGPGIPDEVMSRLGEPFFSTKTTGTGLGLMVCYRIIEAHHGQMEIISEPSKGTIVEIRLLTADREANHALHI